MLRILKPTPGRLCDRISRRQLLEVGGIGLLGLSLPGLLRAEAAGASEARARAKSCILIFLNGGPSHLDMWDMKPEAPAEVRGEFKPIATTADGIQVSEHLPQLARHAHRFTLIRSAYHRVSNAHAMAVYCTLTGHDRGDATVAVGASGSDYPAIGAVLSHVYPPRGPMAPYVCLPYWTREGAGGPPQPGFTGGWLGQAADPFFVLKDPNAASFCVDELALPEGFGVRRLTLRRNLLQQVNRLGVALADHPAASGLDAFQQRAFAMITAPETRQAFDLWQEPAESRARYGRNIYGQSVLLARRLIEAGCRMVTVSWAPDANATWDTHGNNFAKLKNELLPQLDACLSALLTDLHQRGLLAETLVVCMGEFGRTPRVNGAAGRDHWPQCYSLLLAGGGVKGGFVLGASDRIGAEPAEDPVTPQDIVSTIYSLLGVDPDLELRDRLDRPLRIVERRGRVLQELIA